MFAQNLFYVAFGDHDVSPNGKKKNNKPIKYLDIIGKLASCFNRPQQVLKMLRSIYFLNPFYLLLVYLVCTPGRMEAQSNRAADEKLSVAALSGDLDILREVLETVHPGLYRYTSKEKMDELFTEAKNKLSAPLTEIEFYRAINPIIVSIRDEHTFALPSANWWKTEVGQTAYANQGRPAKGKLFPFFIRLMGQRMFIENNMSENTFLNAGDEIVSINGKPISEVLDILLPTIPTNGYIETFRYRHLEQFSLNQTYNRFMIHYAIFIGSPDFFELKIKKVSGELTNVSVNALPSAVIFNNYWRRYSTVNDSKKRKENPLEFKIAGKRGAYIRLSAFHNPVWVKYNYSHSTEFRTIFKHIADNDIRNLVIDLRGNEGGNPAIGMELLQYLCTASYRPYNYHIVKNYRFPALKKYFRDSTSAPSYPDELFIRTEDGNYRSDTNYRSESWSRFMQPAINHYTHKLYVLIDGATGSAASILATLIRVNRKDAIFIGEECGGDMEGPISGGGTDIVLPNSGITVDIPFIKRMINLNGFTITKGRGVMPDHQVSIKPDDLVTGNDRVLNFTLKLF